MSLDRFEGTLDSQAPIVHLTPENGTLTVPDGSLLFSADFQRDGHDLLLVNEGAPTIRVEDYFLTDPPAPIHAPNGSQLSGDVVARLAGPIAPGQYAQAGGAQRGGEPIGQVETIDGIATVQRADGTVETLNVGMKIFQNDVVQTDANGSVSLTFADGTIFTLSSASRMVIDSLIYDPNATDNSASFSLVQGSFVFIAGQVAKTGGMDVNTPSATMGIRGTTVLVRLETINGSITTEVTLVRDDDGAVGRIELRALDGTPIQTIETIDDRWLVTTDDGETFEVERTTVDEDDDREIIADAFLALQSAANRVSAGDTFVTLPSGAPGANGSQLPGEIQPGEELNGIDEPIIENNDVVPGQGGSDGGGGGADQTGSDLLENDAPQLEDTNASAPEDGVLVGSLAATDVDGDPLTYSLLSGPSNGTVNLSEDGSYSYLPNENFEGEDSFEVQVEDEDGATDTATVFVDVTPVNDTPVVTTPEGGDTGTIEEDSEDGTVSGELTASDPDLDDSLTWSGSQSGDYGELVVEPTGEWTYTIDPEAADPLVEGEEVVETFDVTVEDSEGATADTTIEVLVTGTNDAATISGDATGAVGEDGTQQATGTLATSDIDTGEAEVQPLTDEPGVYGTFSIDAAGTWTYTLDNDNADVQALPAGAELTDTFTVTSEDGTDTQEVVITITGTNDAATISGDATGAVGEDGTQQATGTLATSDIDTGEAEVQPQTDVPGVYGTFSIDAAGDWTYTLDNANADVQALPAEAELTDTFTVTSEDGTDTQDVVITITGTNDAATISGDATGAVVEDGTQQATGTLATSDVDTGEAEVQPQTDEPGVYGTFSIDAAGTWTYTLNNEDPDIQALPAGAELTDTFTVTSEDGTDTQDVVITITGTNDAATIPGDATGAVGEDGTQQATGTLATSDVDTGEAEVQPQTDVPGVYGTFSIDAAGDWTYTLDNANADVQALPAGAELTDTFTVTSEDGTDTQEVVITITGTNDAATISGDATGAVGEDGTQEATGTLATSDVDTGEAEVQPQTDEPGVYGTFSIDAAGTWSYTLDNANADVQALPAGAELTDTFTVTSEDGTDTQEVVITISGSNDAADIGGTTTGEVVEDGTQSATGTLTNTDPDGGQAGFQPVTGLAGVYGTLSVTAAGVWTYTLTNASANVQALGEGEERTDTFTVTSQDGTDTQDVVITITGTNDDPEFLSIVREGDITELEDGSEASQILSTSGLIEIFDTDSNDVLSAEVTPKGEGYYGTLTLPEDLGQFSPETGGVAAAFSWTFTVDDSDLDFLFEGESLTQDYDITVTDSTGATVTETVTITIIGTNDTPVFVSEPVLVELTDPLDDSGFFETGTFDVFDADTKDTVTFSRGPVTVVLKDAEGNVIPNASGDEVGLQPVTLDRLENFTIYVDEDGTWTVDSGQLNMLTEGYTLELTTTITAMDDSGAENPSATQDFTVIFTGTNDVPEFRGIALEGSVDELPGGDPGEGSATLSTFGLVNVFDIDQSDVLDVSFVENGGNYFGTFSLPEDIGQFNLETTGVFASFNWTFEVADADVAFLAEGQTIEQAYDITVTDAFGASATETVTITITGTNDRPEFVSEPVQVELTDPLDDSGPFASGTFQVADADVNDTVTFGAGPLTIVLRDADGNVIPNASGDEEGLQPVTLERLENFTIFVDEDGNWQVDPGELDLLTQGYELELTTTITATDDSGTANASTTQEFSVTFIGTNDTPLFVEIDDEGSINELPDGDESDGSAMLNAFGLISVLDIDQSDVLNVSVVPNNEGYVGTFSIPEDIGQFNLESTGVFASFNWDFDVSDADIAFLAAGQTLVQTYNVTVTDAYEASATETVTITITGANDAVVIGSEDVTGAVTEDDLAGESEVPVLTDTGVIGFSDVDLTDVHSASASFKSTSHSMQLGVLTALVSADTTGLGLGGEVTWSFSVDNDLVQFLGAGETITEVYEVSVTDNQGSTITRDVSVTITGTNDAPIIAANSEVEGTVTEDAVDNTTSGQLSATDPEGDTVIWGIQGSVEGAYGDLSIDATGLWTYTLDNAAADELSDGGATETFVVTVTDTVGDPAPQTVDITINIDGNNDAPRLDEDLVFEDLDGATVVDGTLSAENPEPETVTFAGLSSGAPVNPNTSFATTYGSVSIAADGQFIYTPNSGYVGFDSFAYRATDAGGNTTDGTATVAVESDDGSGGDNPVDISINANPTVDTPAGSLFINVNEVSAPRVNVVFALDRSGSVREDDWIRTIDEIEVALNQLLTTFGSSETQVTVGFTVFNGGATAVESFDLNRPNATTDDPSDGWADELDDLRALNTTGATNWTAALNEANTFFDAQQVGASNFLFFITDGEPTVDASQWQAARDNVENASYGSEGLELAVRIEAFGIGPAFTGTGSSSPSQSAVDNLNALDSDRLPDTEGGDPGPGPYYTALTDPSLLSAALTESPVFNPSLVSLSVELDVVGDGLGPVQVADQTSRALAADELDYVMAFAEIENLADQLGVENRFTVRAQYDLDGNGIADLELFSTELLGRADTAQTIPSAGDSPIELLAGSDLLFGSDATDDIASQAGNDLILGYGGNDTLNAGEGIDSVLAGQGDDLITLEDAPTTRVGDTEGELMDGGAGQDRLVFKFTNDISENVLDNLTIRDIETLDMTNDGGETTMRLTLSDVINMSSDSNAVLDDLGVGAAPDSVLVLGDAVDNLFLTNGSGGVWVESAVNQDIGGGTQIDVWQYTETGGSSAILATVGVQADMDVETIPPSS